MAITQMPPWGTHSWYIHKASIYYERSHKNILPASVKIDEYLKIESWLFTTAI